MKRMHTQETFVPLISCIMENDLVKAMPYCLCVTVMNCHCVHPLPHLCINFFTGFRSDLNVGVTSFRRLNVTQIH